MRLGLDWSGKPSNKALSIWFPPSIEKQERLVGHSAAFHHLAVTWAEV